MDLGDLLPRICFYSSCARNRGYSGYLKNINKADISQSSLLRNFFLLSWRRGLWDYLNLYIHLAIDY